MTDYAVGDLQGCLQPLASLLAEVGFNNGKDTLWVAGDLVNRGPDSLGTLRFIKNLNSRVILGNHDLHLLAIAGGHRSPSKKDTLDEIINAPDKKLLLDWLKAQPLVDRNDNQDIYMSHAGLPCCWSPNQAFDLGQEVSECLSKKKSAKHFFEAMYGNQPDLWLDDLTGTDRLRCITNYLTRMRFTSAIGRLDLDNKGNKAQPGYDAWFKQPRKPFNKRWLFGHWAAINGDTKSQQWIGLDTGYVWGGKLTLYNIDNDQFYFHQNPSGSQF